MKRVPIGQMLVEGGAIDAQQLRSALDWQRRRGGRLGSALVHLGMMGEMEVTRALGEQLGLPVIDLAIYSIDPDVLRIVSGRIVEVTRVLPLALLQETRRGPLVVATAEPQDVRALDEVAFASGKQVRPMLATKTQLDVAIAQLLGRGRPEAVELPPEPLEEMELVRPIRADRFWN